MEKIIKYTFWTSIFYLAFFGALTSLVNTLERINKTDTIERELFIKRFNKDGTVLGYNLATYAYETPLRDKLAFIRGNRSKARVTIKEGKIIKVDIEAMGFRWE